MIGHRQYVLCAAVILFELDDFTARVISLEFEDVIEIRTPPAIDRLIRVAGSAKVFDVHVQATQNGVLGEIGILIFVDHDIAKTLVELLASDGIFFK